MRQFAYLFAAIAAVILGVGVTCALRSDAPPGDGYIAVRDGQRYNTLFPDTAGDLQPCVVCHRVDATGPERSAPPLWDIVGASKARAHGFGYSPALAGAQGVWSADAIDSYLADPQANLPGTYKTLSAVRDPEQRQRIVAALQALRPH